MQNMKFLSNSKETLTRAWGMYGLYAMFGLQAWQTVAQVLRGKPNLMGPSCI
jgi:hypothetical protein